MFESIRRVIRSFIGSNSRYYRAGSALLNCLTTITKEGFLTWWKLHCLNNGQIIKPTFVSLKNLKYPISLRPKTKDIRTIVSNVIREEYGHFSLTSQPVWMIDAGAYIGDTSAYFLSRFSTLKVIALEPNPESYEIIKTNLAPYGPNAIVLQKGLFSKEEKQKFSGSETSASISTGGFNVECTTIEAICRNYMISRIDILKMDIEGAEEAIFMANPEKWLSCVDLLIIEIHGIKIEALISNVLNKNGFKMRRYRSVWYCSR